jgi:hypothetical protein
MAFQASTATVNAVLKTVYPGTIGEQLNNEVGPWAVMEPKLVRAAQGKGFTRALHVGRNQSIAARSDLQRLPGAGVQRSVNATINLARNYIIGQFTGGIVRDSYDDKAAFVNVMYDEMTRSLTDFTNDLARQVATGHARLAKLTGAAAGVTVLTVDSVLNLGINQRIQIFNGATEQSTPVYSIANDTGGALITNVDRVNSQITVDSAQTASSGAFIYRAGNFDGTNVAETQGLKTMIANTGTYFGINRATVPEVQANVYDMVNTTTTPDNLFEDALQAGEDLVTIWGGDVVDLWYYDFVTRRRYLRQLQALRQYVVSSGQSTPSFSGGAASSKDFQKGLSGAVTFNNAPVIASRRIDAKTIYGLKTDTWEGYKASEIEWVPNGDGTGGVLHPLLAAQGLDAFMFACNFDSQPYCNMPSKNVTLINTN